MLNHSKLSTKENAMDKCTSCGEIVKENGVGCDWQQGRCPYRNPFLTEYHFRYLNLFNAVKKLFSRG